MPLLLRHVHFKLGAHLVHEVGALVPCVGWAPILVHLPDTFFLGHFQTVHQMIFAVRLLNRLMRHAHFFRSCTWTVVVSFRVVGELLDLDLKDGVRIGLCGQP